MKTLFVGNFLSSSRGTAYVTERVISQLEGSNFKFIIASSYQNKILRLLDIVRHVLFSTYDILHIDVFSGQAFHFAAISVLIGRFFRSKKRLVLNLHGGGLIDFTKRNIWTEKYVRTIFNQATIIASPSLFLKNSFEKMGFKVRYIPNFIDLNEFRYNREHVQPFSLLWVRAFTKIYNPAVAVKVLYNIIREFPEATLTMIGPDKGLLNQTMELIEELQIRDKVNIAGPVSNARLCEYYQRHAVYLNTTSYESFGVAVVEAASCGVPVVSFSVGEIPYLWKDGENILLCEPGNINKMSDLVKLILSDSNLSNRLSANAHISSKDFTWEKIGNDWHDLLKR